MRTRVFFRIEKTEETETYFQQIITPLDKRWFSAKFGRVGASCQEEKYLMAFYKNYIEMLKKQGYIERENYMFDSSKETDINFNIDNKDVKDFLEKLANISRQFVVNNSVNYKEITSSGIEKAEKIIEEIEESEDIKTIRKLQKELYIVIPRYTKELYFSDSLKEVPDFVEKEKELLDAVRTVVATYKPTKNSKNFFKEYNIDVFPTNKNQKEEINKYLGKDVLKKYDVSSYRVVNHKRDRDFKEYVKNNNCKIHYLYHGSRNENALNLILKGPLLPNNVKAVKTGAMFGGGIYTAKDPDKSLGYTDGGRWNNLRNKSFVTLFVFKCATKDTLHVNEYSNKYACFPKGLGKHDCVYAHKGKMLLRDEIIFYNEKQVSLQYVIKLTEK